VSFDETNLVSHAGLLPAAILAQQIDLAGLIDSRLRLTKHAANSGSRALSVIGSMLVGGDDEQARAPASRRSRAAPEVGVLGSR
jgi:hypothetical protein